MTWTLFVMLFFQNVQQPMVIQQPGFRSEAECIAAAHRLEMDARVGGAWTTSFNCFPIESPKEKR